MAIANYPDLRAAVSAWLLRSSTDAVVTDTQIRNYISLTEAELNRILRVRELEAATSGLATVAAQDYVAVPADFRKLSDLQFDDFLGNLNYMPSKEELKRKWSTQSGRPLDYTIFGSRVYLGPIPDAIYPMTMDYFTAIPTLTDAAPTNAILTTFPDAYLYGAVRQAYLQTKDTKNKADAEANYGAVITAIRNAEMEARMAPRLRMQVPRRLA